MRLASLLVLVLTLPAAAQPQTTLFPGQSGSALLGAIDADYSPDQTLGYGPARDELYAYGQRTFGQLCGIYTDFCVQLTPGADPSSDAFQRGINAEHTWPQSKGARDEPARSDLHHLFPSRVEVNSARGSFPFAEIPDASTDVWYRGSTSRTSTPTSAIGEWSEKDADRFEPREARKGDVARAMFYFRAVYPSQVSRYGSQGFFDSQKDDLGAWHDADPVDLDEYARTQWVAALQGTPNPFVLDPTLANRAYSVGGAGPGPGPGGALWVNELHYDNAGSDTGEGVEIAGPAGTSLAGWTVAFYNGNGGAVYKTASLSGTIPNQQGGFGTVWVPVSGLQNGAPDGLALVDPNGAVAQFLSYEGALTATSGPAAGQTATDLGVSESATTAVGRSLQLNGAWQTPRTATPGQPNAGQTLGSGTTPPQTAAPVAWVNELHYDNRGPDRNEGVEIAGTAGLDLTGWTVALYNGSNRSVYGTVALSGAIDDEGAGAGARWFARAGLQNGGPDGLALVDASGTVVEFLSYEGTFTASGGPAAGTRSVAIGVSETSRTSSSASLQRTGTGGAGTDFSWAAPRAHSRGTLNAGQTTTAAVTPAAPIASVETAPAFEATVYPNPARDRATVAVRLDAARDVRVEVIDALGRRVGAAQASLGAGFQSLSLNVSDLPAGIYVVRVVAGDDVATRRLTVVR